MDNLLDRAILRPYLRDGKVDYDRLMADERLDELFSYVAHTDISSMDRQEQLAFWLNAYNLLTLKAVTDRLRRDPSWRGNLGLWSKIRFFVLNRHLVAGRKISLYSLENKVLRGQFRDPRIHFAINCASVSCPVLPSLLFDAASVNEHLDELTRQFVNSENVKLDGTTLWLSPIFKWYRSDFQPSVIEFIRRYSNKSLEDIKKIRYLNYDWSINST